MRINVSTLRKEAGAKRTFSFIMEDLPDTTDVSFREPAVVSGRIENKGNYLEITGEIKAQVKACCSRCLEETHLQFEVEFTEKYCHAADWHEISDLLEEESDITLFTEDWLDLHELVCENILISLPMNFLCNPNCPGLCPRCGCNLKYEKCQCQTNEVDPRLAVLARLKQE